MKSIEQCLKESVDGRKDGLPAMRARLHREIAAERRRSRFFIHAVPVPLRAAAALAVAGLGVVFLLRMLNAENDLPLCPHAAKAEGVKRFIASGKAMPEDFIYNPEKYDRICHCSPRYSGNMR